MTTTSAPRHSTAPEATRVWPLDDRATPADLGAALAGVNELVAYLQRAVHPSSHLGAVDAGQLGVLMYAVAEFTTGLPNLVQRLGDHVDDLGADPTLRHTEAQRGEDPATVIREMHLSLLQAEVSARSLHGLLEHCRSLCAFLTHHRPQGHPHAA